MYIQEVLKQWHLWVKFGHEKNNELVSFLGFNSIIRLFKDNNKNFCNFETPFYFNRNKNYPLNYNFTYPKSAPESVLTALLKGDFKRKLYKVEQMTLINY